MKKVLLCLGLFLGVIGLGKSQQGFFMANYQAPQALIFGSWDSLTSGSVTNAANATINFSSFYNQYKYFMLVLSARPLTDNTNLLMLISSDGSTYPNSGSDYNWNLNYGSGSSAGQPDAAIHLMNNCGNTSGYHSDGFIFFQAPSVTGQRGVIRWDITQTDISGGNAPISGGGSTNTNRAMQSFRLSFSSGNITCDWKLLGSY